MHLLYTKCPGGYPTLHRGLKLSSKNSTGQYKQNLSHRGQLISHRGVKQKFSEYLATLIDKIFETNSSFHVKWCTTGKKNFQQLFSSIDKIFIFGGRPDTRLWKVSKYYDHDCLKIFRLLFMSLLTASIVKNSHILAGIYFRYLKKRLRPNLNTKFGTQWKDLKSSYQVRQDLSLFCNLVALSLS